MPDPDEQLSARYTRVVLEVFQNAVNAHDIAAVLRIVTDDVILVGSDPGELAFGRDALVPVLKRAFADLPPMAWDWEVWEERAEGSAAWFFASGKVTAGEQVAPYQASGVCRRDELGEWKLAMFHGATPD